MPDASLRFVPSRIEGADSVDEVAVFPDRLELVRRSGTSVVGFADIARWPSPRAVWKLAFACGLKPRSMQVADRDWFHRPPDRFFRFYTDPPLVIFMPNDELPGPYAETWFVRIREMIHSGGFHTFDLG